MVNTQNMKKENSNVPLSSTVARETHIPNFSKAQTPHSSYLLNACVWVCRAWVGGSDLQTQLKFIDYITVFILHSSLLYVFARSSSSLRKVSFQKHFKLPGNYYWLWEQDSLCRLLFVKLWEKTESTELLSRTWHWQDCHFSNTAVHW